MNHKSRPQSIAWFQTQYREGRLTLRPPFQRKPVWTDKQRSSLIESILLGIPIPEVYIQVTVDEDGNEEFGVVDGQQRLRTILQFVGIENEDDQDGEDNNSFALDELAEGSIFYEGTFSELGVSARKAFFQYEICVRFLYEESITTVQDVFRRLNKYTMPLKPPELRNATYHGAFAKLAAAFADDDYWAVHRIVSARAIRRMADIEFMSELLIGLIHGPQGGAERIINEYYDRYERYEDEFPEQARIEQRFKETLAIIQRMFPDISETGRWGNRADFYSLFVAIGAMLKDGFTATKKAEKALAAELIEFGEKVDARLESPSSAATADVRKYVRSIEKGSNEKSRRSDRHEVLLKLIDEHFA